MAPQPEKPVIFFDGVCGLCNKMVDYLLLLDKKDTFLFSPLQGETFKSLMSPLPQDLPDSLVLLSKGRFYFKSDAVLQILSLMGGMYKLGMIGYLLPRFLRNALYDWVAKKRYGWFGKKESCRIPSRLERTKFLP
jgi:predicted DCC family thiol-disulfide oxidoreductase YuxK